MLFNQQELYLRKRKMNWRNRKTESVLNFPEIARNKKWKHFNNSTRNFKRNVNSKNLKMKDWRNKPKSKDVITVGPKKVSWQVPSQGCSSSWESSSSLLSLKMSWLPLKVQARFQEFKRAHLSWQWWKTKFFLLLQVRKKLSRRLSKDWWKASGRRV